MQGKIFTAPSKGDYHDNDIRFGFFAKAIFVVFKEIGFIPDVIHLHDYHFALSALLLEEMKTKKSDQVFLKTGCVFTIHNLAYQGIYNKDILDECGIDKSYFNINGIEFYGKVNYMKAGIVFSDRITTVSPTYAKEILTPEYGYKLDGILKSRQKDLSGIINGIDYSVWDPETDASIYANYGPGDLSPKKECKKELLSRLFGNSVDAEKPLLGVVSRLSEQKGFDLLVDIMERIMDHDLYLVILGTGEEKYHNMLSTLQKKYSSKFSLTLGYSDKMSREIYSGSDIFLMPSNYEPCGLGQLISLKYGTIPVVRNTGGLADTIIDINTANDIDKGGQGFKFDKYGPEEFYSALKRALGFYRDRPQWEKIVSNGMHCDFSWDYSAKEYMKIYEDIMSTANNK